jgi:hypothetical protein
MGGNVLIEMQRLSNPAKPLLDFGEVLGISPDDWVEMEELEEITYNDDFFSQEKAKDLTLDHIFSLRNSYGDALGCSFRLGDLPVLDICQDTNEESLRDFLDTIEGSPTVVFNFTLNKKKLVESWIEFVPCFHIYLYLFPNALENFLSSNLSRLENSLWASELETDYKVIFLIPDREIWLDGSYLAVIGGEQIGHLNELVSKPLQNTNDTQDMYEICQKNLNWQIPWLKRLTPLHLNLKEIVPSDDIITKMLMIHQVNSVILYTADRTMGDKNKPVVSTYSGANQSVELTLLTPKDTIDKDVLFCVNSLMEMLEWAYNSTWSADRIPLVQIGVAQALYAASPFVRYQLLLHNAKNIFEGLKWHWKAFIEDRVDNYVSQIQALEDYVENTVQEFADQISDMIKKLSDTMLAAVGVLIGSFIASLFKDDFDSNIFAIGMVAYATYVFIFPLFYNMKHQNERYHTLCENFSVRQTRFEKRLYPDKVNEIVGTQISASKDRFEWWFKATFVAYVIVILLSIFAALLAKEIIDINILPLV